MTASRARTGTWALEQRRATLIVLIAPVLLIGLLFVCPILELVWLSVSSKQGFTFGNYAELTKPVYAKLTLFTLELAAGLTVLAVLIGYPIAYLLAAVGNALGRWIATFLLLSLWLSILTRTYGWIILLQRNGVINEILQATGLTNAPLSLLYNQFAVVVGMLHLLLPFMVVTLLPTIRAVDTTLIRAALGLGASPWRTFWTVYLPLTLPGIIAGSTLVFVMAIGYFVTPAILGGGKASTIAMAIKDQVLTLVNLPLAAATSVTLLIVSMVALVLYERFSGVDRLFSRRPG